MKNKWLLVWKSIFIVTLLTGCSVSEALSGASHSTGEQETNVIRIAYNLPEEHATGVYFEILAEEIEERTKDTSIQLITNTFPNGQLYNDTQLPIALSTGGLEIGQITTGFLAGGEAAPLHIVDLPFLFDSWEAIWEAEDGRYGDIFDEQYQKLDMKLVGFPAYGTLELYANSEIQVPEDLSGLIMRGFGQGASLMLEELGASPVSMSSQEIYQALEHGSIDGYTTGPPSVVDRSFDEVTDYGTDMTLLFMSFQSTANLAWWESLPEDVQQAVIEASEVAQAESRKIAKREDANYKEEMVENGVELYTPTEEEMELWREAASNRHEAYIKSAGDVGAELMELVEEYNKN